MINTYIGAQQYILRSQGDYRATRLLRVPHKPDRNFIQIPFFRINTKIHINITNTLESNYWVKVIDFNDRNIIFTIGFTAKMFGNFRIITSATNFIINLSTKFIQICFKQVCIRIWWRDIADWTDYHIDHCLAHNEIMRGCCLRNILSHHAWWNIAIITIILNRHRFFNHSTHK